MAINAKPEDKSDGNTVCDDMTPFLAITLPNQGLETELNEEEQQKEEPGTKEDFVSEAMICNSSLEVPCRLSEHDTPSITSDAELAKS